MYWYANLKRKWNESHRTRLAQTPIMRSVAMLVETISGTNMQNTELAIGVPHPETSDLTSRALHYEEKCEDSVTQNLEKINKEIENVAAKMMFYERKFENIESYIADMKKTQYANMF